MAIAKGMFPIVIKRKGILQRRLRPEFSFLPGLWISLFSEVFFGTFFLFGTITSPHNEQARHSKAITRLHPLHPNCLSNKDVRGATRKVPAPDPQTQIPKHSIQKIGAFIP